MHMKKTLLTFATLLTTTCLTAQANFIPQGYYATASNIAGYNVIHDLQSERHRLTINGKSAQESTSNCDKKMPGSPCQVKVTWQSQKGGKPISVTETIRWATGVMIKPRQFALKVIDDRGRETPRLVRMR